MSSVFLILGSNLGNRMKYLADAEFHIAKQIGKIKKSSPVYETAPWGFTAQPFFLNKVIEAETSLKPMEVLHQVIDIEKKLGRTKNEKWHERVIDIDILFFDNLVLNTNDLKIPHPNLHERRFTLIPLNEIAGDFFHPVLKKTIKELLEECTDECQVQIITVSPT